jgi:hypothetical protein
MPASFKFTEEISSCALPLVPLSFDEKKKKREREETNESQFFE